MSKTLSIKPACLLYSASLAFVFGCSAEIDVAPDASEEIAAAEQALLDDSCWTQATADKILSANANATPVGFLGTAVYATSPNELYGQPACPNQWIVDVWEVRGKRFMPYGSGNGHLDAPAGWCEGYWSMNRAQGWIQTPCAPFRSCQLGRWQDLGSWTTVGQRRVGPTGEEQCIEWPINNDFPDVQPSNHPFMIVRTVTVAGFAGAALNRASAGVLLNPPF